MATFNRKVLRLLRDELTGTIKREIDELFEDNGVALGPPQPDDSDPGERRERMRRYLASLDLANPSDAAKLTAVYSDLMQRIAHKESSATIDAPAYRNRWAQTLRDAGFVVDPWTWSVSQPGSTTTIALTDAALAALTDAGAILDHLARLADTVDSDPRLAVSTAKALIESTAKLVLAERKITYPAAAKVPKLVAEAMESLKLSPRGASDENASLRQVLQSLVTLTQGVTEIRNQVGVDHGAESVPTWVRPRHARLVVGAAHVWCQLMLETLGDPDAPWRDTGPG